MAISTGKIDLLYLEEDCDQNQSEWFRRLYHYWLRLSKEFFRYGRHTRFWLLQLREDLFIFLILHKLDQILQENTL